jgi:hypothetical protein
VLELDSGHVAAAPSSRLNVGPRAIEAHVAGGDRVCVAIVSEDRERAFEIEHQVGRHRRSLRAKYDRHEQSCLGGSVMYSRERRSSSLLAADRSGSR